MKPEETLTQLCSFITLRYLLLSAAALLLAACVGGCEKSGDPMRMEPPTSITLEVEPVEMSPVPVEKIREKSTTGESVVSQTAVLREESSNPERAPIVHAGPGEDSLQVKLSNPRQTPEIRFEARNRAMAEMIQARKISE